jgi:sigma-B regulation protein RsbU (phosphoserine phosphatase)
MNSTKQLYGEERLLDFARRAQHEDAKTIVQLLREDVASFVDGAEQSDDITILALRRV